MKELEGRKRKSQPPRRTKKIRRLNNAR